MRVAVGIVSTLFIAGTGAFAQQYTISTVAGGTPIPTPATALNSPIGSPGAMTTDAAGNVYFVADDCVFKIDLSGNLNRVAGNSRLGFSGDGGAATSAQLYNPGGLAVDSSGNIYIADSGNNRIRKVTPSNGNIATIAGLATAGFTGDTGLATSAQLNNPQGLAIDSGGNLYIADTSNHAIRKITAATGVITTIAGTGFAGNSGDGQPATSAQLNGPQGVAVDASLNVYISDSNNQKVREIQNGVMSTIAGNGIAGYSGDLGQARTAQLSLPTALAVDTTGNLYITDANNLRVRKVVLASGVITTVAGGGLAPVSLPSGIATDTSANLYVADSSGSKIVKYTPSTFAIIAGSGTQYNLGDGGNATAAQLVTPQGLAVSAQGIYIADKGEARIRKILPGGVITTPNGGTATGPTGVAVDSGENLYIADAAANKVFKVSPAGVPTLIAGTGVPGAFGDGGLATVAQLNQPSGVALDAAGNVYIADTVNNRIRKVTIATGIITTIAGSTQGFGGDNQIATSGLLNQPAGITLDNNGNIYIADTGNNRIREITTAGIITTVAGNGTNAWAGDNGPATQASISSPHAVAVDGRFNLYIPDFSGRVRKVNTSGIITTIAGSSTQGYSGDTGPALSGQLSTPWGITVDGNGYVYVSDPAAQAVRELSPTTTTALAVQTSSLPNAAVGQPYAQTVMASGGTPPYTWTSSTLPPGLTLSSAGSITGTPTASGTFFINFQVTDSGSFTAQATIGIVIAGSAPNGLTITTSPLLIPGAVGVSYSQPLSATSGNPPYTWTVVSGALPAGLTLSPNGVISGVPTATGTSTFTVRLNDNVGSAASQTFTLTVIAPGTLTQTGVLGHIAVGGTWTTRVYLTNISNAPLAVSLLFYGDNGGQLSIPFTVTQQGASQQLVNTTYNAVLNPNTALVINSGAQIPSTLTGWIQVLSSGAANSMAGYAIFETTANGTSSEGTTPLQTNLESKMDLPFDDTNGFVTGVAVANLSAAATTVTATVLDNNGNQLGSYSLPLQAYGHTSFLFPAQFAVTNNQQGLVLFQSTSGGGIAGVGLRANTATGAFTSVPVILP